MSAKPLVAWGLGDQFRVLEPLLAENGYSVLAGVDDTITSESMRHFTFPISTNLSALLAKLSGSPRASLYFVVSVANPYGMTRVAISEALRDLGMKEASVIADRSYVSPSARVGSGVQILPDAVVHVRARVGRQVIVNTRALVEHDCVLERGSEIGPGAVLCGRVVLRQYSWVGAGAVVLPRLTIGANALVGAGAVVTHNVPAGSVVVGNPAREISNSKFAAGLRSPEELKRLAAQLGWSKQQVASAQKSLESETTPK